MWDVNFSTENMVREEYKNFDWCPLTQTIKSNLFFSKLNESINHIDSARRILIGQLKPFFFT